MINNLKELIRKRYNISFSKSGDDIQLMKIINQSTPGVYVDVGCWHPFNASNTYHFYLRDWKGICIDANPEMAALYRKYRPADVFINAGVGTSTQPLTYCMFEESSMNTFDKEFIVKHDVGSKIIKRIDVEMRSLSAILEMHIKDGDRLDFFDIDVEGFDLEVLKSNNWDKFRPKVILVESDNPLIDDIGSEIVRYLEDKDYRLAAKSIINGDLGNLFLISK
ncbi:MAG: SAM-dependent methyltransferase [Flavobacterium sp. BFFFF1]|uniref:FkbM family methyltransferase n=1 Tax=unclassified Flavobacterium TaxID=196869 RepID=UPI000BD410DA|nr:MULTISPECIES: FkbM family methyltransferase [unclassified Flavobacterium]OYU80798.1 MAG: SAM-dependent methyltransferase [Flavobacterium sp. BFFFF1]